MGELAAPAFLFAVIWVASAGARPAEEKCRWMVKPIVDIDAQLDNRLGELGFELVSADWVGSVRRPVLRLRIDRPDADPGAAVSVGDCAAVSRALEPWLDQHEGVPERYVLEVSSPGVERPLTRPRDFLRFSGRQVAVCGSDVLAGRTTRLEGELLGLDGGGEGAVRLRLPDGDEVRIPRQEIRKAHLVFTWK